MLSVLDVFRIGIGPSSSHTVGPMRIAARYVKRLERLNRSEKVARVQVRLLGSLAWTGEGHGSPRAVMWGLLCCSLFERGNMGICKISLLQKSND